MFALRADGDDPAGRVAGIIVNYNAERHLVPCVASLRAAGVAEVVVADNASTDGSARALATADATARWVPTGGNLGFGSGANRGAAGTTAELLLVLNADVVVRPDVVRTLVAAMDDDATLGVVGPRIENTDGTVYPSPRTFPNMSDAIGHAFLGMVWHANPFTRRYRMLDHDRSTPSSSVDWVSGSCFLVRRTVWEQLGGFDESYFMYVEDVDLCWRAGRAGWRVRFEPAAVVTHVQGASTDLAPYRMILEHHRSLWRWSSRTMTGPRRPLLPLVALGLGVRCSLAWTRRAFEGVRSR